MRFNSILARSLTAQILALSLCPLSALAESPETIKEAIGVAVSPDQATTARVDAANEVTENWHDSLPLLLQEIDAYYNESGDKPYSDEATSKLIPLTDLLSRIVVSEDSPVQSFRAANTEKTVQLLAAAAGGTDRTLRANSSYILARVVDDDNLCIILHQLDDPNLSYEGRVNLLRIAIEGTNTASRENAIAAEKLAESLKTSDEVKTARLASLLEQIANARARLAKPLPFNSYCARYDIETGHTRAQPTDTLSVEPTP